MASIYWRKPRTGPPDAAARFDLDCTLTDGLVGVYAPSLMQGNLWSHRPFASIGAGLTRGRMQWEEGEAWNLASSPLRDNDVAALGSTATLAVITRTDSSSTAQTILSIGDPATTNWLALNVQGNGPPEAQARSGGTSGTATTANSVRFRRALMVGSFRGANARSLFVRAAEFDPRAPDTVETATNATAVTVTGNTTAFIGALPRDGGTIQLAQAHQVALGVIGRLAWTDEQADRWLRNPWQLWAPEERRVWVLGAGPTGGEGTLTATLAAATSTATGTLLIQGVTSATLGAATAAATGALAIAGTTTATLAAATSTATGTLLIQGTTTATLAAATVVATGELQAAGTGTLTATLAAATVAATGTLRIAGMTTATLGAATSTATGALQIKGTLTGTLAAATLAAEGTGQVVTTGALTATLAPATVSSAATLRIQGALAVTLGNVTSAATGRVDIAATLGVTLADAILVSTGTGLDPIAGTLTATLADASLMSVATIADFVATRPSAPPIGHGPALATRKPPTTRRRAPNLSTRTR